MVSIAALAGVATLTASAEPRASRVVDRTFSCESGFVGGLHQVTVYSTYSADAGSSKLRASLTVAQNFFDSLGHSSSDGFSINRQLCVPSGRTVKLTTKGLRGGATPALGAEATCETSPRLLLRVRALFRRPVTPQTSRQFGFPQLTASGDLETAALAIATRSGKQIAYLSVTGIEKARFFTHPTCKED